MRGSCVVVALAVGLAAALAQAGAPAETVAPELPVAGWHGGAVGLEDFKGQVTAVVFFNDSNA